MREPTAPLLQCPDEHADEHGMKCTRCNAQAVIKRGDDHLCGRCSIAADWQILIATIQDARVETPIAGGGMAKTA